MEFIDMRFIMNRLLDSPITSKLKLSSAATYVKDFASINCINPIIDYGFTYTTIKEYKAILPPNVGDIVDLYLCDTITNPLYMGDNRISATLKTSKVPNKFKRLVTLGVYKRTGNVIDTDIIEGVFEVYHSMMRVDDQGFPMLPYDGSLMEAVVNYIKYRYFSILSENDMIAENKVQKVHSEYTWYIGQYTMKNIIPTYDEAVAWANSWQRLLDLKDLSLDTKSFPQHLNI